MISKIKLLSATGILILLLSACDKKAEDQIACTLSVRVLLLNFNVIDAATQQDLYFSNNPRFSTREIYLFKQTDQSRRDTIRPNVTRLGSSRYFSIPIGYEPESTFILKAGNLPENTVTYQVSKTGTICTDYQLKQVMFNGTEVKVNDGGVYTFFK